MKSSGFPANGILLTKKHGCVFRSVYLTKTRLFCRIDRQNLIINMYVGHDPTRKKTRPFRVDLKPMQLSVAAKPQNALGVTFDDDAKYERAASLDDPSLNFFQGLLAAPETPQGARRAIRELVSGNLFVRKPYVIPEQAREIVQRLAAREIFEQTFLCSKQIDDDPPRLDSKLLFDFSKLVPGFYLEQFTVCSQYLSLRPCFETKKGE